MCDLKQRLIGTSLVDQWLRLQASTAGGNGLISGWGTKIPHATQCSQKNSRTNNVQGNKR